MSIPQLYCTVHSRLNWSEWRDYAVIKRIRLHCRCTLMIRYCRQCTIDEGSADIQSPPNMPHRSPGPEYNFRVNRNVKSRADCRDIDCARIFNVIPYKKGIISDWCRGEPLFIHTVFLDIVKSKHQIADKCSNEEWQKYDVDHSIVIARGPRRGSILATAI